MAATTDFTGFVLSIFVVFGYSFLLASFVLFLVKEKESKVQCGCVCVCVHVGVCTCVYGL